MKNLGKSNISLTLILTIQVKFSRKIINTLFNIISNSLLIFLTELISLHSLDSTIRFSPLIEVIHLLTILINSEEVKVRGSNHSNLRTMSLRMLLEMLRNLLLKTVILKRSLMYKGISVIVLINSFTCSISLLLEDLIHHKGIGSILTTFHIHELIDIHLALKTRLNRRLKLNSINAFSRHKTFRILHYSIYSSKKIRSRKLFTFKNSISHDKKILSILGLERYLHTVNRSIIYTHILSKLRIHKRLERLESSLKVSICVFTFKHLLINIFSMTRPLTKDVSLLSVRRRGGIALSISDINLSVLTIFANKRFLESNHYSLLIVRGSSNFSIKYLSNISYDVRLERIKVLQDESSVLTIRHSITIIINSVNITSDTRSMKLSKTFLQILSILIESNVRES